MLKCNTTENWFAVGKIIGDDKQIRVTIPNKDWGYFEIGERVKLVSTNGLHINRKVSFGSGKGRQRSITIPKQDRDIFKKGDKIKMFPFKQPEGKSL